MNSNSVNTAIPGDQAISIRPTNQPVIPTLCCIGVPQITIIWGCFDNWVLIAMVGAGGGVPVIMPALLGAAGLLCDLLWSDPVKEVMGWGENDRGVSFTFGPEIVSKYLAKHDMDLICRAHQVRGRGK